ncbi:MAG: alpha/beta hydrolase [Myxococcota bacterium]|nr:alpha/beta hydrolase [Myxococcota bacterium]
MPTFVQDDTEIYYEESGEGFPVLLFAPGGMRSSLSFWAQSPWNPIEALRDRFRVIAMDQRNAGRSRGPISATDDWTTYTGDHLALLDHLEIDRCHLLGGCIGGPYCLGVIKEAPERVAAAVLQQPIGLEDNRPAFYEMFDGWAESLRSAHPHVTNTDWESFRSNMYDGNFVFNVTRDFVAECSTPMLVLMGDDLYHPQSTSREIAESAPDARLIEDWKSAEGLSATIQAVRDFLLQHSHSEERS